MKRLLALAAMIMVFPFATLIPQQTISSLSGHIFFISNATVQLPNKPVLNCGAIFSVDVADGAVRQLTFGMNAAYLDASPDGNAIVFAGSPCAPPTPTSQGICNPIINELYSVQSDGSQLRQLTHLNNTLADPLWSPDGTMIAFTGFACGGKPQISVIDSDGQNLRALTTDVELLNLHPIWKSDSSSLIFLNVVSERFGLYEMRLQDGILQAVNNVNMMWDDMGLPFALSPGGAQIVYKADEGALNVMYRNGDNIRLLTDDNLFNNVPVWSPDGTQIAYLSWFPRQGMGDCCYPRLFVINADGTDARQITSNQDTYVWQPTWSPDGSYLAFTSGGELLVTDLQGSISSLYTTENTVDKLVWAEA